MTTRRAYSGNAVQTKLSSAITNTATSISVDSVSGYPTSAPFYIVVNRGTVSEEKMLVGSVSGSTFQDVQRGADGSTASSHAQGSTVEHIFTAVDANDANAHVSDILRDDHGQYLNNARHDTTSRHSLGTVIPVDDGQITTLALGDAANAGESAGVARADHTHGMPSITDIESAIWHSGDLKVSARSSVPGGWLLCDGSAVSRTTYAALFAAIGTTFGSGNGTSTFNVPDYRGRVVIGAGQGSGLTDRPLGSVGGAETVALTEAQVPAHTHPISHTHTTPAHQHTTAVSLSGSTDSKGSHNHAGTTGVNNKVPFSSGGTYPQYGPFDPSPDYKFQSSGSYNTPFTAQTFYDHTQAAGQHTHSFTTDTEPAHNHAWSGSGTFTSTAGQGGTTTDSQSTATSGQSNGGSAAAGHANIPPYGTANVFIKA